MNAITVPSVALPSWTRSVPTHSTAPVASTPSHSIAGKNTAQMRLRVDARLLVLLVQLLERSPELVARG